MNNEEFDRRMRFILEHQAMLDANWDKQQDYNAQVNARLDKVDRQIEELSKSMSILRDAVIGLTYHVERHDQQITAYEKAMTELVERGKETDARLNALILTVERHLSGNR